MTRCAIVLPARLESTRLPRKLLRRVGRKSVLQHTFESASRATATTEIVVAVDHQEMADEVDRFGGRWIMTGTACPSGTDRIAEVAKQMPDVDVFVNVQADEPEICPEVIDRVTSLLISDSKADMSTAGTPIRDPSLLRDPACVKIVMGGMDEAERAGQGRAIGQGKAIYFSRAPVPFVRDGMDESHFNAEPPVFWHHIGLYAYRRDFLAWFASTPPGTLEQLEKLEQLRAVEAGKIILVARVESATPGIDTLQDLEAFESRFRADTQAPA